MSRPSGIAAGAMTTAAAARCPAAASRHMSSQARYGAPATRQPGGPGADSPEAVSHTASIGRHHSAAP